MRPSSSGDSSSATMFDRAVVAWLRETASAGHTLPIIGISSRFRLRERSGLIAVQVSPRSSLRYTLLLAQYNRRAACGLMMYGASQLVRSAAPRPPLPPRPAAPACPAPPDPPAPPDLPASSSPSPGA